RIIGETQDLIDRDYRHIRRVAGQARDWNGARAISNGDRRRDRLAGSLAIIGGAGGEVRYGIAVLPGKRSVRNTVAAADNPAIQHAQFGRVGEPKTRLEIEPANRREILRAAAISGKSKGNDRGLSENGKPQGSRGWPAIG